MPQRSRGGIVGHRRHSQVLKLGAIHCRQIRAPVNTAKVIAACRPRRLPLRHEFPERLLQPHAFFAIVAALFPVHRDRFRALA